MYRVLVDNRNAYEIDDREFADRKAAEFQRVYPGAKIRVVHAQASDLGQIQTPRKSSASRANIDRINQRRAVKACTCGQDPHKSSCPAYARLKQAESRQKRKA